MKVTERKSEDTASVPWTSSELFEEESCVSWTLLDVTVSGFMGSLNWTKAGNTKNAENVHIFRGARDLADRHEAYSRGREAVSEPYKTAMPGPQKR